MPVEEFESKLKTIFPWFKEYLSKNECAIEELNKLGWKGGVKEETLAFLKDRLLNISSENIDADTQIATYFSCILIRKTLKGYGVTEQMEIYGKLEIGFTGPLPDSPTVSTRINYRYLPFSECKIGFLPHWRAHGVCLRDLVQKDHKEKFSLVQIEDPHYKKTGTVIFKNPTKNITVEIAVYSPIAKK